jgi:hypothetical protein
VRASSSLSSRFVVSAPALHLSSEYLKLFTAEAVHRAAEIAKLEKEEEQLLGQLQGGGGNKGKGKQQQIQSNGGSEFDSESPNLLEVELYDSSLCIILS